MEQAKLIVIEGVDGSGKTTLSKEVVKLLNRHSVKLCSRKQVAEVHPFISSEMKKISELMWTSKNGELDHLLPTHYWIHLQAVWYTLLCEFVIKPLLEQKKTVIVDGWYYKFFARLLTQPDKYNIEYLEVLFSHVLKPDAVFLLNMNIDMIWARKQDFKLYELGTHQGYASPNRDSFIEFQTKTKDNLHFFAEKYNWFVLDREDDTIQSNALSLMQMMEKNGLI